MLRQMHPSDAKPMPMELAIKAAHFAAMVATSVRQDDCHIHAMESLWRWRWKKF